jgi:hypothetical protein
MLSGEQTFVVALSVVTDGLKRLQLTFRMRMRLPWLDVLGQFTLTLYFPQVRIGSG